MSVSKFHKEKSENFENIAIIDVRPVEQYGIVNIPGSVNIPSGDFLKKGRKEEINEIFKSHEKVYIM